MLSLMAVGLCLVISGPSRTGIRLAGDPGLRAQDHEMTPATEKANFRSIVHADSVGSESTAYGGIE